MNRNQYFQTQYTTADLLKVTAHLENDWENLTTAKNIFWKLHADMKIDIEEKISTN